MTEPNPVTDRTCTRLQQQIALSILVDDLVAASLAANVALARREGGSNVDDLEHAIRLHRVAVLKQGAILGAAGIEV